MHEPTYTGQVRQQQLIIPMENTEVRSYMYIHMAICQYLKVNSHQHDQSHQRVTMTSISRQTYIYIYTQTSALGICLLYDVFIVRMSIKSLSDIPWTTHVHSLGMTGLTLCTIILMDDCHWNWICLSGRFTSKHSKFHEGLMPQKVSVFLCV